MLGASPPLSLLESSVITCSLQLLYFRLDYILNFQSYNSTLNIEMIFINNNHYLTEFNIKHVYCCFEKSFAQQNHIKAKKSKKGTI